MLPIFFTLLIKIGFGYASECGPSGKIQDRIDDCNLKKNASFTLVSKNKSGQEVHLMNFLDVNLQTGQRKRYKLLWSAVNSTKMNTRQAMAACRGQIPEALGLSGLNWRLPKMDEFHAAYWAGVENGRASKTREILQLHDQLFFTSEVNEYNMPWMFEDIIHTGYRHFVPVDPSERHHVICVAET